MRMHVLAFPIAGLWSGDSEIARDPHVLAFLNHRAVARWFRDRARYSPRLTSWEIISPTFPAKTSRDLPTTSNNGTSYNAAETIKGRYLVTQRVIQQTSVVLHREKCRQMIRVETTMWERAVRRYLRGLLLRVRCACRCRLSAE